MKIIKLSDLQLNNLGQFLGRANLQGTEVRAFNELIAQISKAEDEKVPGVTQVEQSTKELDA